MTNAWSPRFAQISAGLALVDGVIDGLVVVNKFGRASDCEEQLTVW